MYRPYCFIGFIFFVSILHLFLFTSNHFLSIFHIVLVRSSMQNVQVQDRHAYEYTCRRQGDKFICQILVSSSCSINGDSPCAVTESQRILWQKFMLGNFNVVVFEWRLIARQEYREKVKTERWCVWSDDEDSTFWTSYYHHVLLSKNYKIWIIYYYLAWSLRNTTWNLYF